MDQVSIDGRRRTKSSALPTIASRNPETPIKLRPASPPKSNPWSSSRKSIAKPVADMFPPLPKPQTPQSPVKALAHPTSRASSISSCGLRSRDDAVLAAASASPSSNTSTTSRHIFEAAAPRAAENLWISPFGADVVVRAGNMTFRVHRNIVVPESGWFRENLPPPMPDGIPVEVHIDFAPEAVAHCLRFIYTGSASFYPKTVVIQRLTEAIEIEICEHNREQPWNAIHLPRCVLGYCASVFLRISRMTSRLLQIVERTSIKLGGLVRTVYLHQTLERADWVQFSCHYQSALDILFHQGPKKLMMPMRLAMASVLDAVLYWLIRQPLFLSMIRTTWYGILQTSVLDMAEYRQLLKEVNPCVNSPLPDEAALKKLFAEADAVDKAEEDRGGMDQGLGEISCSSVSEAPRRQAPLEYRRTRRGSM
ncbi:hypothetical protein FZEAL_10230 [Fusarium zealandicum]|uniref:BTB domain-containing protein n=1 Tax=Fusarium zealandicum TaxID=1053134 RepID=A0A8H4U3V5_9HYPO|nr:hypothetical protein FZEAL_10230 [Fusarium zealandicum]